MMHVKLKNADKALKAVERLPVTTAKATAKATDDLARRALNTVVKKEISKVYNIKQADVASHMHKHYDKTGSTRAFGVEMASYRVEFTQDDDKTFTPRSFGMTPMEPAKGKRVVWIPLKGGGKRPIVSNNGLPVFLQRSKTSPFIPWARYQQPTWRGGNRLPIGAIKTHLSVPVMMDNVKVQPNIEKEIAVRLDKAVDNAMSKVQARFFQAS